MLICFNAIDREDTGEFLTACSLEWFIWRPGVRITSLLIVLTVGGDLAGKLSEKRKAVRRSAKPCLEKWLKCPSIN